MTEDNLISLLVVELRERASAGESTSSLLGRIQLKAARKDCKLLSVRCFHKAFDRGVAAISPVAEWVGFGGELSDAEVNSFVNPILEGYRQRCKD